MNLISVRLGLLLFVSGMCSLIFQTSWFREFRLIFGASTLASSAVLAVFMGGLGLGNAILGKRADQTSSPLKLYAKLELAISAWCLLTPWILSLIRWFYLSIGGQETLGATGATVFRLIATILVIGGPTFLMGGTLPAAAKALTTAEDKGRRSVGLLYGCNTFGAVAGTLLSTFFLFESFGTRWTLAIACSVNGLNSLAAIWVASSASFRKFETPMVPSPGDVKDDPAGEKGPIPEWSLYFAAGIIGAVFFMMEMVWYRMLSPILGGSTFTFGLILAVALAGIGIGGAIYPVLFRNRVPTLGSFIQTLAWESLCIAVPFALGDWLAILAMSLQQFSIFGFWGQAFGWIAVTIVVVLPAAILAGVQFAVLVGLIGEGNKDVGRQLGNTFAWNTLGSIIGSLAGGFGLMTLLTAPGVWRLVIVSLILVALLLWIYEYRRIAWRSALMAWVAAIVSLLCLTAEGPTALWRHGGIGAGRIVEIGQTQNEHRAKQNSLQRQIIFESDGREAAVAIANTESLAFLVNGKSDGNAYSDAGTQIMLGMVGAMQHPNPKRSLVVGLGTGESAGWLASVSSMEQVDVVELEPAVLEMARLCSPINHDVLNHPKVNIIINDAREHLQTTKNQYDIIASEPSNPYRAGISSLYTREFYLSAAERLRQGGIFSQWLQAYEVDVDTIRIVFATLRSVFPYMEVWQTLEGDMVITCSMEPLTYTIKDLRIKLAEPEYAAATRVAWHTTDVSGVMSHLIASDAFIEEVVKRSPRVNTDDSNHLEFGFARTVGKALGFSLETLIGESEQEDARWPDRLKLHVDKQRVADLKSAVDAISASGVTVNKNNSSLVAVWKAVEADSHGDAVQIWDSIRGNKSFKDLDYAELCLLGISLAKTKDPRLVELLAELAKYSESNANALAIFALGIDQQDLLANQLRKVYLSAQNDPSILPIFLLNALVQGQELASVSPSHSPMIYQALRNPLALHRHNEQRINALISAGQSIGANAVAGVLEDWEPFPIWTQSMLALRLRAYRETNSRYVEQAENDWRLFMERAAEVTLIQESDLP